jgi:glycosyltransferase involved in cell wall biosynthesis
MKILEIAPPWFAVPPAGYGGIEWVVALLADRLAERGHDVTLFASAGSKTKAKLETVFDPPPGGPNLGKIYYDLVHAVSAYKRGHEFDLIHDHSGIVGPAIGSFYDKPVVHTLHGPWTEEAKDIYRLLVPPLNVVAISNAQRDLFTEINYAGTVYNGVALELHPFRKEKEEFLLFLGRVNKEKGPEIAVEVAKRSGLKLVMAVKMSEEFEQVYWRENVEPRLTGKEEIIGEITIQEKADLLGRAKGVLFPIQWPEPFGLVMAEANACGTPVISFANGAAPEVIADGVTGFLINSIDEMVEAVGRLDDIDPAACRAHVEEKFSAESMTAGYEEVFENVLKKR